jgi:hypothetical protein
MHHDTSGREDERRLPAGQQRLCQITPFAQDLAGRISRHVIFPQLRLILLNAGSTA